MGFWITLFLIFKAPVVVLTANGVIGPPMAEYIVRGIEEGERRDAQLVVIELDTPGGLDESMREIVKKVLNTRVPVCVYIYPPGARAASAGVFITLAAHIAAMAPGTNIGAAHPVTFGQKVDTTMIEKITNDAVAYIKSIARKRGRNAKWAEEAVRKSSSITEKEALKKGVIDLVANNLDELLQKLDGKKVKVDSKEKELSLVDAPVLERKMNLREKLLYVISNPNIAYILLILGFYGLFFELSHPGAIFPGVFGIICLVLAFYAFHTLPVNYAGIILILAGMIMFLLEIKIQSHGLLGLGGVISLFFGSLLLSGSKASYLRISITTIIVVVAFTLIFFLFIVTKAVQAMRRRPWTGTEGIVGMKGVATRSFRKGKGVVLVHGELWQARSDEDIKEGDEVLVVGAQGLILIVKKLKEEEQTTQ